MIENTPEARELVAKINAVILRLSMVSHGPSQSFNPAPPPDDVKQPIRHRIRVDQPIVPYAGSRHRQSGGSQLPGNNTMRHDDRQFDYRQKSDQYFAIRLQRWDKDKHRLYGTRELAPLLEEAERAHTDWLVRPLVEGNRPAIADPEWKRYIATCGRPTAVLASEYSVSIRYINKIKAMDWSSLDETADEERKREREAWERRRERAA